MTTSYVVQYYMDILPGSLLVLTVGGPACCPSQQTARRCCRVWWHPVVALDNALQQSLPQGQVPPCVNMVP